MSLSRSQRTSLENEIQGDPLARGYAGMTDLQVLTSLLTVDRTRNKSSLSPSEVYQNIDQTEWDALSAADQDEIWNILHLGDPLDPFGKEATRFIAVFGGGSNTITALQALRIENISRLQEIGIGGTVTEHQIKEART